MSNKTSDENVANIEDDVREIKESIKEAYRCYDYDLDYNPFSKGIAEMVEHILAEREQDKKRIKKLEEENVELLEVKISCSAVNIIENLQKDIEQKDKRIQELEEENTLQRRQLNSAFDNGYIHTDKIRKLIANETINISGFECIAVEDLQELLGGEEVKNVK